MTVRGGGAGLPTEVFWEKSAKQHGSVKRHCTARHDLIRSEAAQLLPFDGASAPQYCRWEDDLGSQSSQRQWFPSSVALPHLHRGPQRQGPSSILQMSRSGRVAFGFLCHACWLCEHSVRPSVPLGEPQAPIPLVSVPPQLGAFSLSL